MNDCGKSYPKFSPVINIADQIGKKIQMFKKYNQLLSKT